MDGMFNYATSFTGDLSDWLVGNVDSMSAMFGGAKSFDGDLSRWDVRWVENMEHMFDGATSFNGDLSGWDVGRGRRAGQEHGVHVLWRHLL